MISIVLYGRNDSYGYNLHKRAALSFNCMAELLTDDNDEILFVDYNTPDDFPTFPEAIQDTLTPLARRRLRILRVRPPIHKRFQERTRLVALEPVSRNVAVRRSNPANRWILSTNTDMVFVPRGDRSSLSDIVRGLPPGFYHAPRLEIPETLWEGLDRQKPQLAIETIKDWGTSLHLNEIVLGAPTILYDGPGDFQLIERADLFKYHGFDEEMILGWHVDSNIAKRLYLVYGKVGDLGEAVLGYHCDHTRQITPAHSHNRTENDWRRFVENLTDPDVPAQAASWGCADDEIEEVRLSENCSANYVSALRSAIGAPLETIPVVTYAEESYGTIDYDPRHILPFLADLFVSTPRNSVVAWMGLRRETLDLFAKVWSNLGFTEPIIVDEVWVAENGFVVVPGVSAVSRQTLFARANAFVIDFGSSKRDATSNRFGGLTKAENKAIARAFLSVIGVERLRWIDGSALRRIACLNAIHTPYETLVRGHVGAGLTPFATRMRHGFALPPAVGKQVWTSYLQIGDAAFHDGQSIHAKRGVVGQLCYGPYQPLLPAQYRIELEISGKADTDADPLAPIGVVELLWGTHIVDFMLIQPSDMVAGRITMEMVVDDTLDPTEVLQTVVRTFVPTNIIILSLRCEETGPAVPRVDKMLNGLEWLSLLTLGPCGEWTKDQHIALKAGTRGFVAFGPYWTIFSGRYELDVEFESDVAEDQPFIVVEVFSLGRYRAVSFVNGSVARPGQCLLHFEVHENETPTGELPTEVRIRSTGVGGLLKAVKVRRVGDPKLAAPWIEFPEPPPEWQRLEQKYDAADPEQNWVPFMCLPALDEHADGSHEKSRTSDRIALRPGFRGLVAYGPYWTLPSGRYEVCIRYASDTQQKRPFLFVDVFSADRYRAVSIINGAEAGDYQHRINFEVHDDETSDGSLPIEIRLYAAGTDGVVTSVNVRRIGDVQQKTPWIEPQDFPPEWIAFFEGKHPLIDEPRTLGAVLRSFAKRLAAGS
jgi:hypothetical protein